MKKTHVVCVWFWPLGRQWFRQVKWCHKMDHSPCQCQTYTRSHMHVILSEWTVTCFYIYLLSHTFFFYSSCVLLCLLLPLSVSLARGAQCCMESDWFFLPFLLSLGFWQNHGSMETKKTALWQQRGRESRIFHICCGKRWWRSYNRIHNHSLTAHSPAMQD